MELGSTCVGSYLSPWPNTVLSFFNIYHFFPFAFCLLHAFFTLFIFILCYHRPCILLFFFSLCSFQFSAKTQEGWRIISYFIQNHPTLSSISWVLVLKISFIPKFYSVFLQSSHHAPSAIHALWKGQIAFSSTHVDYFFPVLYLLSVRPLLFCPFLSFVRSSMELGVSPCAFSCEISLLVLSEFVEMESSSSRSDLVYLCFTSSRQWSLSLSLGSSAVSASIQVWGKHLSSSFDFLHNFIWILSIFFLFEDSLNQILSSKCLLSIVCILKERLIVWLKRLWI